MNFRYPHTATLWRTVPDGFGGYIFSAPEHINCRWVQKQELIPGSGTELSAGVVYTEVDVTVEDYLLLGTSNALSPAGLGASRVRMFGKIPDLRNLGATRKSWIA